jgi:hypothetical protein
LGAQSATGTAGAAKGAGGRAGSQLKRLTSTGHHMELYKQLAIASLKIFGITDACMRVLVPIAHNAHHHNEPYICSGILFFNDECIANMHHLILRGRL